MCGRSQDFSRGLKKKKRLSMGQSTWTHNLGDFCRRQEPGPHPQSRTTHNNLYSLLVPRRSLNTFPIGRCLFVSISTCGVRSQIHRSIMGKIMYVLSVRDIIFLLNINFFYYKLSLKYYYYYFRVYSNKYYCLLKNTSCFP